MEKLKLGNKMREISINMGPTVVEAAWDEVKWIVDKINELLERKKGALLRIERYDGSKMLESERIALKAEPFQRTQLEDLEE